MRRLLAPLTVLLLVASACGSTTATVDAGVELTHDSEARDEDAVEESSAVADDAAMSDEIDVEEAQEMPEPLPNGREALLANRGEGKPYVLWFWGAN